MARISTIDEARAPALAGQIARIRAGRRGKLIPVYGLLLHNPPIAAAWLQLLDAVRWQTRLAPRLREIAILRVASLNRARYVIDVHRLHFTEADGLSVQECDALLAPSLAAGTFSAAELAAVHYIDAMTLAVQVPQPVFDAVRAHFTEAQMLDLTVLVGVYNMHTRVICALEIDNETPQGHPAPEQRTET